MDAKLKQRLVGAAVLAALIFIVLAVLLKNNSSSQQQLALNAKTQSLNNIQTLNNSNANNNPVNDDTSPNGALNNSPPITTSSTNNNIPSPENIAAANSSNLSGAANTSNINTAVKNAALNNQPAKPAIPSINPMSPAVNNNTANNTIANKVANNQPNNIPAANKAVTTTANNQSNNNVNPIATTNNTPPIKPITQTNNLNPTVNPTIQSQPVANQAITADNNPEDQSAAINAQANQPAAPITNNMPAITQHHKHKVSQLKNKAPAKSNELIHSLDTMPINNSSVSTKSSHGQKIWAVQVGSFKDSSNAMALSKKLKAHQFNVYTINFNTSKGERTHVYVGAKSLDKNAAEAIVNKLQKTMNMNAILVANTPMPLHKPHAKSFPANKSSSLTEGSNTNA